ncbi:unnamed protein product [Plutella xylostella]|uniref:V-type proton ATPase subunit a n=1 Tax=Plutella xylostella TaxID=51655 RepID=A0A8S4GHB7_PLUXY|nr:unnamed protein product [Plutella xylostella]
MMLFKTDANPRPVCDPNMYAGQVGLQKFFVILALMCVPVMLFGKPYFIMQEQKKRALQGHQPIDGAAENGAAGGAVVPAASHHDEDITEVFIHQAIHTIEYVLGSISHTASYLRLWALSLAHAQLAEVAWNMLLREGLQHQGFQGGIVLWAVFAAGPPSPCPSSCSWRASPPSCTRCGCTGWSSKASSTLVKGTSSSHSPLKSSWTRPVKRWSKAHMLCPLPLSSIYNLLRDLLRTRQLLLFNISIALLQDARYVF